MELYECNQVDYHFEVVRLKRELAEAQARIAELESVMDKWTPKIETKLEGKE